MWLIGVQVVVEKHGNPISKRVLPELKSKRRRKRNCCCGECSEKVLVFICEVRRPQGATRRSNGQKRLARLSVLRISTRLHPPAPSSSQSPCLCPTHCHHNTPKWHQTPLCVLCAPSARALQPLPVSPPQPLRHQDASRPRLLRETRLERRDQDGRIHQRR